MRKIANQQLLSIVGWIVAALIILGINGAKLTSLRNSIYEIHSTKTISTGLKANQLEEVLKKNKEKEIDYYKNLDKILLFGSKSTHPDREILTTGITDGLKKIGVTILPQLSGVIQVSDINGDLQSFAIIEGKRYKEKEQAEGFTLSEITSKGVWFTKNNKRLFAPMPSVPFSVNYLDSKAVSTQLEKNMEIEKPEE